MSRIHSFLSILLLTAASVPASGAEPFRYPEAKHGKAELKYINGLAVLTVEGTPEEIGEQAAMLVAQPSKRLLGFPKELLSQMVSPTVAKTVWPVLAKETNRLYQNYPPDHRKELDAMIKVSGFDRDALIAANTLFDLKALVLPLLGCSALVVEKDRSATGQPIFGRNMDYNSLGYLHEYTLITVYRPKGKHAFAAIGWPGMVGVVSGMNDAGLCVAALETTGAPKEEGPGYSPEGTPFASIYRRILEECTTIDEAEKVLREARRTTTNHLTVCDKNGGAVFEFSPSRVAARRPEQGCTVCTNHFNTKELKLTQPKNTSTTLDRFEAVSKARADKKKLGVAEIQKYLHAANQGNQTIQTMVFEPGRLTLHLAISDGKSPSSALPLKQLELGPLLK